MSKIILETQGICKRFPGTVALDDVNFTLEEGEIHALIGENGAGKSTLMNILVGIHAMDAGEILLKGEPMHVANTHEALMKGISMVPQELNLVPALTVAENIFIGNERLNKQKSGLISWKKTQEHAQKILDDLGMSIDVRGIVKSLTTHQQQMVSIARSLVAGAEILIFDEPTASLTTTESEVLFETIFNLKKAGKSIIYISHHLDEIKKVSDRTTIMRDSRVVHMSETKDISIDEMIFYMANRKVEKTGVKQARTEFGEKVLEVKNLSLYKQFEDISFDVHQHEILGVAGLVGSGISELFKSVFGINKPDSGTVSVRGIEVQTGSTVEMIKLGVGYVPEERRVMGIFPFLDVAENMMISSYDVFCNMGLIKFPKVYSSANTYKEQLKIKTSTINALIKNLSGGNQQKVILARWMSKNVQLMILDNPTRGIDVNAKGEIHSLIKKLADNGLAVVVISTEMEEISALADRIMVMHEGKFKGIMENTQSNHEDILKTALQ